MVYGFCSVVFQISMFFILVQSSALANSDPGGNSNSKSTDKQLLATARASPAEYVIEQHSLHKARLKAYNNIEKI